MNTFFTKDFYIPDNIKVISFDVFDTLMLRPFEKPTALFSFLNPFVDDIIKEKINFKDLRKKAEKTARKTLSGVDEVNIDEIYENFTEIPTKLKGAIKFLEMEAELKLCFPRESGRILYEVAKARGLKLVATSDIYLETEDLTKLLNKNGFYFDEVFSSASLRKTKRRGSIYPLIAEKLKVLPKDILHIGDNKKSDIIMAESAGLATFYLPILKKELYKNPFYKEIFRGEKCVLTSASIGMICDKLDREEQEIHKTSLFGESPYKLGFNAFGIILFAFSRWVFGMCKKHNIKKLFFIARDGYIMQKVFEVLYKNVGIETSYLECSRRSLLPILINSKEDVVRYFTKRYRNTTIKDFIIQKLECDPLKIQDRLKDFGFKSMEDKIKHFFFRKMAKKRLLKVVSFYADEIFEKMQAEKANAMLYLKKSGVLEDGVAICDVGYSGTIQNIINKVRNERQICGFYLITNHHSVNTNNAFGFLANRASKFRFKILASFVRLIESVVLCSPSGTTLNYNNKGEPIFAKLKEVEIQRLNINKQVWDGVVDFASLMKMRFGRESEFLTFRKNSITKLFTRFCFLPIKKDVMMLKNVVFENTSNAGGYRRLVEDNLWKMGRLSVLDNFLNKLTRVFIKIWLKCNNLFDSK
jgi:predicted HAD superfamily hydrolase